MVRVLDALKVAPVVTARETAAEATTFGVAALSFTVACTEYAEFKRESAVLATAAV